MEYSDGMNDRYVTVEMSVLELNLIYALVTYFRITHDNGPESERKKLLDFANRILSLIPPENE